MTEENIKKTIAETLATLDELYAVGNREAMVKAIALLDGIWNKIFYKDDDIRHCYLFQGIWIDETTRGEETIFADISSVADVTRKYTQLRHAFYRFENDFPLEMCLEAMQWIAAMRLSNTAFHALLENEIEDVEKVLARINEISAMRV